MGRTVRGHHKAPPLGKELKESMATDRMRERFQFYFYFGGTIPSFFYSATSFHI